jgi:hypothetical protein
MKILLLILFCLVSHISFAQEIGNRLITKVKAPFAYINEGTSKGIEVEDHFVILRSQTDELIPIADVVVVRVFPQLAIAEILSIPDGYEINNYDYAVTESEWTRAKLSASQEKTFPADRDVRYERPAENPERISPIPLISSHGEIPSYRRGISLYVIGGYQRDQGTDIRNALRLTDGKPESADDYGLGARIGWRLSKAVCLGLSYKLAGILIDDAIFGEIELTQHSIELDFQYFFPALKSSLSPYIAWGPCFHYLTVNGEKLIEDTSSKWGMNLLMGAEVPLFAHWKLISEGGYQYVYKGDDTVDFSNVRLFLGIGHQLSR